MTQFVSNVLTIMRQALGRQNRTDPNSTDTLFIQYLNDFIQYTMGFDIHIFEEFATLEFTIDQTNTTGVYTFNDVGGSFNFSNTVGDGFISLTNPPEGSVSWNQLYIFQDPIQFYNYWGVNNTDVLIPGYPTQMLYYGTEMVFRTIPNTSYDVIIYGYKLVAPFTEVNGVEVGDQPLPFDYWVRYLAYGAARNYAYDYHYEDSNIVRLEKVFALERKYLLNHTHTQIVNQRCIPRF